MGVYKNISKIFPSNGKTRPFLKLPGPLEFMVPVSERTREAVEESIVVPVWCCYHSNLGPHETEYCLYL